MNNKWEIEDGFFIVLTDNNGHKCRYSKPIFKHAVKSSNGNYFKNTYNLSQEEIDDLVAALDVYEPPKDSQLEFELAAGFNWQQKPLEPTKCPPHNFVEYLGLNERFMHCKDCGEKKV